MHLALTWTRCSILKDISLIDQVAHCKVVYITYSSDQKCLPAPVSPKSWGGIGKWSACRKRFQTGMCVCVLVSEWFNDWMAKWLAGLASSGSHGWVTEWLNDRLSAPLWASSFLSYLCPQPSFRWTIPLINYWLSEGRSEGLSQPLLWATFLWAAPSRIQLSAASFRSCFFSEPTVLWATPLP